MICSLRTNLVFVWIFFTVTIGLGLVAALFWYAAERHMATAHRCQIVRQPFVPVQLSNLANDPNAGSRSSTIGCCMSGWYLLLALMLPSVDFPLELPVGDLSHLIPGRSGKPKNETVPTNQDAQEDSKV